MFGESKYWELHMKIQAQERELERLRHWVNMQDNRLQALLNFLDVEVTDARTLVVNKTIKCDSKT